MSDDDLVTGKAKGGVARAESLSKERRAEIAAKGAQARWAKESAEPVQITHTGTLELGGFSLPCYVTATGERLLSGRGLQDALRLVDEEAPAKGTKSGSRVDRFLSAKWAKPLIYKEKGAGQFLPIKCVFDSQPINGYRAEILADICEAMIEARKLSLLTTPRRRIIAEQCEVLMRGFMRVGIIALVDEATGYQYERPRRELEDQLKKFISESLRKWVRTFPADYFKHLCRLRGVELRPDMKLPQYFGKLTNNLVYRRLAPGLVKRLKARRTELGSASNKLHSWLSADVGFPEVLMHLGTVVGLMKLHTDYDAFEKQLNEIAPIYPDTPGLFDDPKDWEST
jgi:hypothetical protein